MLTIVHYRACKTYIALSTASFLASTALAHAAVDHTHVRSAAGQHEVASGSHVTSGKAASGKAKAAAPRTLVSHGTEEVQVNAALQHGAYGRMRRIAGGGLMARQTGGDMRSTVTSEYINKQAATTTAYQAVSLTPGANFSQSDPYGFAANSMLSVRGLGGNEVGQVWEGMPVNDIETYNGYPTYWADGEDIESVSLTQGSAAITAPVMNAAGGQITTTMRDPGKKFGGLVDYSYGTLNLERFYGRIDSGEIGHTGLTGYVSFSNGTAKNSLGPGRQMRRHVDFAVKKDFENGDVIKLNGSYVDMDYMYNPNPTKDSWNTYGRSYAWGGTFSPGSSDYWQQNRWKWEQIMLSMPSLFKLPGKTELNVTPYFLEAWQNSPASSTLSETGNYYGTQPVSVTIPGVDESGGSVRSDYVGTQSVGGVNAALSRKFGDHKITLGYWYQYGVDDLSMPFSSVSSSGLTGSAWSLHNVTMGNGEPYLAEKEHTVTQTNALYLQDEVSLLQDRLKIVGGIKALMVNKEGTNGLPGPQYHVGSNNFQPLPRLSVAYKFSKDHQVFFNVTTNTLMPIDDTLYNSYSGGAISTQGNSNLKPEYSISEELGYRYQGNIVHASVALFNYNFTNRQVSSQRYVNNVQVYSTINGGGQTTRGVDFEAGLMPFHGFSPYVSAEYLHATIDNNIQVGNDYLPTAGKTAVRSPHFQGAIGIVYDHRNFFGTFSVKYTGSQYSTFMNDEKMPSYKTLNLSLGYRLPSFGFVKNPEIRVAFMNLTDEKVLSGVASPQLNAQTVTGIHGSSIGGSSPQYYIAPRFTTSMTIAAGF
ncbi:MAG: TonB-dependent receptor [Acetobacter okinawensis]|uniref:TonB-dependent receptor n=1 Tax=Acetobacter okinawensis TaxID=1076594 RepID=UPI000472EFAC